MIFRKTYGLPEEILEIISRVREERNIKSDTEALESYHHRIQKSKRACIYYSR